jgi:two-component system nitrogen regulation response regulator NtrX
VAATVLVVDDDQDIRESLGQILTEEGFEVISASNGREALEEIARKTPDVMLLDLMMPVLTGWEVLETLRLSSTHRNLPVVVLSALEAKGCTDFIQKPIQLPKLLALLDIIRARAVESAAMRAARPSNGNGHDDC